MMRVTHKTSVTAAQTWENSINVLPGITQLQLADYDALCVYLRQHSDADTFLTSAAYYFFTGRNGLWSYSAGQTRVFFCWHPNLDGEALMFPPVDGHVGAVAELLAVLPPPPAGLRLARVKLDPSLKRTAQALNAACGGSNENNVVCEEVLDWKHPVRILSTSTVATTEGPRFRNVREGIRYARTHGIEVRPLDYAHDRQDINNLIHQWASIDSPSRETYLTLYETYSNLFALAGEATHSLDGLCFYAHGRLAAVSLWDVSNGPRPTANLYASFCNIDVPGLSRYVVTTTCSVLFEQGVEFLNLGGSETESLDHYKMRFRPVVSLDLCSIEIKLGAAGENAQRASKAA